MFFEGLDLLVFEGLGVFDGVLCFPKSLGRFGRNKASFGLSPSWPHV